MAIPKLSYTKKNVAALNIKGWLKEELRKRELSFRKQSLLMGMNPNYLYLRIDKGNFTIAELINLGNQLDTNPFEPYLHLLGNEARATKTEKEQHKKIAELEEKIVALEKERDWLKEVVLKR